MNIILFGPPGAGKGTQAKRLQTLLALPIIASGEMFRTIRLQDTPLAAEVKSYMDRGAYVPDALTIEMILTRLAEPDAAKGFILDGFPRTVVQAEALDAHLAENERAVEMALHITAPTDVLVMRLGGRVICPFCGSIYNLASKPPKRDMICDLDGHTLERRSDEEPETIVERLQVYERQTGPLIEYYRKQGTLVEIDGSQPIAVVEAAVDTAAGLRTVH